MDETTTVMEPEQKLAQGSDVLRALEEAWVVGPKREVPGLPYVVMQMGTGAPRRSDSGWVKYGHFWRDRWVDASTKNKRHELMITGECLSKGPKQVLNTFIHEAAHGWAALLGIHECKDNYHNKKFKELAEQLGLKCEFLNSSRGFADTTATEETLLRYAEAFEILKGACDLYLEFGHGAPKRKAKDKNLKVATCTCEPVRKIRASRSVLEDAPIICGACHTTFQEVIK